MTKDTDLTLKIAAGDVLVTVHQDDSGRKPVYKVLLRHAGGVQGFTFPDMDEAVSFVTGTFPELNLEVVTPTCRRGAVHVTAV